MEQAIVFVRTGWMKRYQASRAKEPPPRGGGKYNLKNLGWEHNNFLPDASGRCFGYFAVGSGSKNINLFRVDGDSSSKRSDTVSNVLVIFVAKNPDMAKAIGPTIVGWYRNATLYRVQQKHRGRKGSYRVVAQAADAVLVPTGERGHIIPRARQGSSIQGMGQSNIFYTRDSMGRTRKLPWLGAVVRYAEAFTAEAQKENKAAFTAEIEMEKRAGFASNAQIRRAVESRAMQMVYNHYQQFDLEDTSKTKPYDYSYKDGRKRRFIEVKGTQTRGLSIIVTANEVAFARSHLDAIELCIVHSIDLLRSEPPVASGGVLEVIRPWNPDVHELKPLQYLCSLNRNGADL